MERTAEGLAALRADLVPVLEFLARLAEEDAERRFKDRVAEGVAEALTLPAETAHASLPSFWSPARIKAVGAAVAFVLVAVIGAVLASR
jgi:hypothetical protein